MLHKPKLYPQHYYRYVFEWLSGMVCGNMIETNKDGNRFWIAENRKEFLTGEKDPLFVGNVIMSRIGGEFENLAKVFKKDGPQS